MELKYVIIKKEGYRQPIVFSTTLDHSTFRDFHVVSAGFVSYHVEQTVEGIMVVECSAYGQSVTLNICSQPEDSLALSKMFQEQY